MFYTEITTITEKRHISVSFKELFFNNFPFFTCYKKETPCFILFFKNLFLKLHFFPQCNTALLQKDISSCETDDKYWTELKCYMTQRYCQDFHKILSTVHLELLRYLLHHYDTPIWMTKLQTLNTKLQSQPHIKVAVSVISY